MKEKADDFTVALINLTMTKGNKWSQHAVRGALKEAEKFGVDPAKLTHKQIMLAQLIAGCTALFLGARYTHRRRGITTTPRKT